MDKTLEMIVIALLLGIMAEIYILTRPKKSYETKQISMLVDTSALMDGRVVDLARTGFLLGQVIVLKSVLAELQLLADGSDHDKRERARLGMDAVKELKDILDGSFTLLQDGPKTANGVDEQLITLAKETDSAVLTLDYNLNKVAQVEGVKVLNINELAKSIRMVHLPGDVVDIELTQKGQSADQAVGYLSDGTMVVVEHAKKYIGRSKKVEIIRSLQTDAGKMMFAKLVDVVLSNGVSATKAGASRISQTSGSSARMVRQSSSKAPGRSRDNKKSDAPQVGGPSRQSVSRRPKTSAQREAELIRLVDSQE